MTLQRLHNCAEMAPFKRLFDFDAERHSLALLGERINPAYQNVKE